MVQCFIQAGGSRSTGAENSSSMVAAVRVKALMSWGVKAVAREAGGEPWGLATVQGSLGPVGR